jgi:membrane-bound metal-dependent hydrolase YbcI (DUF457 family)
MPSSRVHLLAGAALFAGAYYGMKKIGLIDHFSWPMQAFLCGITLLGSIFPDIDIASNMQKTFYKSMIVILPVAFFLNRRCFILLVALSGLLQILRHRGITHNPAFLIIFPPAIGLALAFQQPAQTTQIVTACILLSLGALSHVVLDRLKTSFLYTKR